MQFWKMRIYIFVGLYIIESQFSKGNMKQDVEKPNQKRKVYKIDTVGTARDGGGCVSHQKLPQSHSHTRLNTPTKLFSVFHTHTVLKL